MILSVRSNMPSFKAVEFTPGFNVILADRTKESTEAIPETGCVREAIPETGLAKPPYLRLFISVSAPGRAEIKAC